MGSGALFGALSAVPLALVEPNRLTFARSPLSGIIAVYGELLLGDDDDAPGSLSTTNGDLKNDNPSLLLDVWKNGGRGETVVYDKWDGSDLEYPSAPRAAVESYPLSGGKDKNNTL